VSEFDNPWLPEFREHVYGLGLISLNYNLFESALQYILWNYTSVETTNFFFDRWNNEERTAAIRHFAKEEEDDPIVLDHIDHLMTYFSICAENRNILMHSRQSFSGEKPPPGVLSLEKRLRNRTGGRNVFHLDLPVIKRVSNEIIKGITYCVAIDDYVNSQKPLNRLARGDAPAPALPNKPLLPRKLDPHRPIVTLPSGKGAPPRSPPVR
jgi:hypothetical protein